METPQEFSSRNEAEKNVVKLSDTYKPNPKQQLAHSLRAAYVLFVGGYGSGKSWWLCIEAILHAMEFSGARLVIIRKELSVIKRTILVTFFAICDPRLIRSFNQSKMEITFLNGSVLTFIEANVSKDPQLNKLRGLEISWAGMDEASEVDEKVFIALITRLRWKLPNGNLPRYEIRLTSNPENCWIVPAFIQSDNPDHKYVQVSTLDNYAETDTYYLNLKKAYANMPDRYRQYVLGEFVNTDSINQLIPNIYIGKAVQKIENGFGSSIGIDVARYGSDKTVFTVIENGNIVLIEDYPQTSITEVATRAIALMQQYNIPPACVGIDAVGLGAGVIDNLRANGYEVQELQGGASPVETNTQEAFKPYNLRAQMYWALKRELEEGNIGGITHPSLVQELSIIRYNIVSDKTVRVLSKDDIKKILGRSPDFADSLVYANWVKNNMSAHLLDYIMPIFG